MMETRVPEKRGVARRALAHAMEIGILALLAVGAVALPVCPSPAGLAAVSPDYAFALLGGQPRTMLDVMRVNVGSGGGGLLLILFLILLSRVVRSRWLFLVSAVGVPLAALFYAHMIWVVPVIREIASEPSPTGLTPGVPASIFVLSMRAGIVLLVPVLAGLYATRRRWSWLLYAVGWAAGLTLMYGAFYGWYGVPWSVELAVAVALNGAFTAAVVGLPLQRGRLEELTGHRLGDDSLGLGVQPVSGLESTLGHVALLVLAVATVFLSAASYYDHELVKVVTRGVPPPHISPGALNAYDVLKKDFTKPATQTRSEGKPVQSGVNGLYSKLSDVSRELLGGVPVMELEELRGYLAEGNRGELDAYFAAMEPYFAIVEEAGQADICLFREADRAAMMDFLAVRTTARALSLRANLALIDGRTTAALRDIETILRWGYIVGTDPTGTLVQHMISAAVRGVGLAAAQNCYLATRDDAEGAAALAHTMERLRPTIHVSFPSDVVRRTEPGYWPIAVYYEQVVPAMTRAYIQYYTKWAAYDQLRLMLALDAYERGHGDYPETLEKLVPATIERLPMDPFEGKSYEYTLMGDEPQIAVGFLRQPRLAEMSTGMLPPAAERQGAGAKHVEKLRERVKKTAGP